MIDITIIVVTYNGGTWARRCLDKLNKMDTSVSLEILVVDNASTEFTERNLREWAGVSASVEALAENEGFARACNRAALRAQGRYILLLNPDAIIHDGALEAMLALMESKPEIGLVGGRLMSPNGQLDLKSCWGFQTLWSLLCFALGLSTLFKKSATFNSEGLGKWQRDTVRRVDIISGCLLLVETGLWQNLGGFDSTFFMYGEDADLCQRAALRGAQSWVTPDALAIHAVGASSSTTLLKQQMLFRGKATLAKKGGAPERIFGTRLLLTGVAVRAIAETFLRRSTTQDWVGLWRSRRSWRNGWPTHDFAPARSSR